MNSANCNRPHVRRSAQNAGAVCRNDIDFGINRARESSRQSQPSTLQPGLLSVADGQTGRNSGRVFQLHRSHSIDNSSGLFWSARLRPIDCSMMDNASHVPSNDRSVRCDNNSRMPHGISTFWPVGRFVPCADGCSNRHSISQPCPGIAHDDEIWSAGNHRHVR